jgi:hypothetical protein
MHADKEEGTASGQPSGQPAPADTAPADTTPAEDQAHAPADPEAAPAARPGGGPAQAAQGAPPPASRVFEAEAGRVQGATAVVTPPQGQPALHHPWPPSAQPGGYAWAIRPPGPGGSPWLELARPARAATLLAVGAGAVVTDLALRSGYVGAGGALLTFVLAGILLSGGLPNRDAWLPLAGVPLFGIWLMLRTSPWLIPFDTLAFLGLLGVAASLARGGSLFDLGFAEAARRSFHGALHFCAGLGYAWGALREEVNEGPGTAAAAHTGAGEGGAPAGPAAPARRSRQAAVATGAVLALPLVIVLGALLASADAVFASFFELSTILGHLLLIAVGATLAAGLLRMAAAKPLPAAAPGPRWLGPLEAVIVLVAVDLLFAVFATAQLVALSEGGRRIIETAGLTYADYARSGFFQLVAAAGLTVAALLVLRAQTRAATGRLAVLVKATSLITVVLTLSLVAVAVRRLDLYMDAYGLTTPRVIVFALNAWIGAVVVLLGGAVAGAWRNRAWLGPAALVMGLLVLLSLNIVNPEALTIRYNDANGHLLDDQGRLTERPGIDGLPALAAAFRDRPAAERQSVSNQFNCDPPSPAIIIAPAPANPDTYVDHVYVDDEHAESYRGWAAFNLLRERAGDAQREICSWRP